MPSQGSANLLGHTSSQALTHPQSDEYNSSENFDEYIIERESLYLYPKPRKAENHDTMYCWICLGDELDSEGVWVNPCHCSLVSHEKCLLAWIAESQRGYFKKKVHCPQCNELYCLYDPPSFVFELLDKFDRAIQSSVPYLFLAGVGCSILITSTTYGIYSVFTVCGQEGGDKLLGSNNPWGWHVWLGLPVIPWVLIFSRFTVLDSVMPLLTLLVAGGNPIVLEMPPSPSLVISVLPWVRLFYNAAWHNIFGWLEQSWREHNNETGDLSLNSPVEPALIDNAEANRPQNHQAEALNQTVYVSTEKKDIMRMVVGALFLPDISYLAGSFLGTIPYIQSHIPNIFLRSILGGCFFIFFKDMTSLLHKYQLIRRLKNRRVKSAKPLK